MEHCGEGVVHAPAREGVVHAPAREGVDMEADGTPPARVTTVLLQRGIYAITTTDWLAQYPCRRLDGVGFSNPYSVSEPR